jgi:hypothetical protein
MVLVASFLLTACNDGGNSASDAYTVTTEINAGGDITPASVRVDQGGSATFTLAPEPDNRIAEVTGCDGTLSGSTYTTGAITGDCTVSASFERDDHAIGGSVSGGLAGTVVLQNNGGDDLTLTGDGTFTFETPLLDGSGYNVTIQTQPSGQDCSVANGSGTVSGDDVTGITVTCTPPAPTLSLTPQAVKTFRFTWTDITGATEYRLLENPDGHSGYTAVQTLAAGTTAYDHEVFLPDRVNASYLLEACNSAGCSSSAEVAVNGIPAQAVGYVKASNPGPSDFFGGRFPNGVVLSADGSTLVVRSHREDGATAGVNCGGSTTDRDGNGIPDCQENDSAGNSGAVYVFVRDDAGAWSQQAYLKAPNAEASDYFGTSVALSSDGDTLAVGAPGEDSAATGTGGDEHDNSSTDSGAVFLFQRFNGIWFPGTYIKAPVTKADARFGTTVALSDDGHTLLVGANGEDSNAGAAYVYTLNNGVWSWQARITARNAEADDVFGTSLALAADGATLAVGAFYEGSGASGIKQGGDMPEADTDDDSLSNSGAVYVFANDGASGWQQQAYIKSDSPVDDGWFGLSVALSAEGGTLTVGAPYEGTGAAYIYTRDGDGVWSREQRLATSNLFGSSVALVPDGDTLAVGAPGESNYAGAVYLFQREGGGNWTQQTSITASNPGPSDEFGWSVALSGDGATLAASAYKEGGGAPGVNCGDDTTDGNDNGIPDCQEDNSATASGAVYLY